MTKAPWNLPPEDEIEALRDPRLNEMDEANHQEALRVMRSLPTPPPGCRWEAVEKPYPQGPFEVTKEIVFRAVPIEEEGP